MSAGEDGPRRDRGGLVGAVIGVAIVLTAVVFAAATIIGSPPNVPSAGSPTASPAAQPTGANAAGATAEPTAPGQQVSCEPRTVDAPAGVRWTLYRAEYGSRAGHDYLRLKLRRAGDADGAARVAAELVPVGEVAARSGLEPPAAGDTALLVRFDGPVDIPGRFGGRGQGSLGEFTIARGDGGSTYVVAAINGRGCFSLAAGAWDEGQTADQADIVLEIERG